MARVEVTVQGSVANIELNEPERRNPLGPGLRQQMQAMLERHMATPTITGEACTLNGYVTRVAAGMGVGLVDAGHVAMLRRSDVVALPLREDERITTYVLHKARRFGSCQHLGL